jgi:serine/threonine protein kinase
MSPELFLSGRVSKASDVYSFGVCVYELVTGLRAFAGVPLPLLPHEVAVAGLRPEWPAELGPGYTRLQAMAAACCAQEARVRCGQITPALPTEGMHALPAATSLCNQQHPYRSCSTCTKAVRLEHLNLALNECFSPDLRCVLLLCRPSFSQIFDALQGWAVGRQDVTTPWDEQQQQQQQVASQSLQVQPQQSGLQDHRQLSQQQTKQQLQQKAGAASARITFQAMQAQQLQQHQQWLLQRQQQQQQQQLAASGAGQDVLQSPAGPAETGAAAGGSAAAGVGLSRFGRIAWSEVSFEALAAGKGMADQQGAQGGDATQGGEAAGGL